MLCLPCCQCLYLAVIGPVILWEILYSEGTTQNYEVNDAAIYEDAVLHRAQ